MPDGKINSERVLTTYVERMIDDKGDATELGLAERDALRRVLARKLNDAIEKAMLASLPDEKLNELEKILERDGSDEELEAFFDGVEGVDAGPAVEKAMAQVREDYLAGAIVVDLRAERAREEKLRQEMAMAGEDETTVLQNVGDEVPAQGAPTQGAISEVPGRADVEGVTSGTEMEKSLNGGEEM